MGSDRGLSPKELVKIRFPLPPDENAEAEWLWAQPIEDLQFRLKNTPLFVEGIGNEDVVEAVVDDVHKVLEFRRVVRGGGHSTHRIALQPNASTERSATLRANLERRGCGIEGVSPRLFAIDIPPTTDIYEVYGLLNEGMAEGTWWFDEMHVGHALREKG
jgi:hypothetical protein